MANGEGWVCLEKCSKDHDCYAFVARIRCTKCGAVTLCVKRKDAKVKPLRVT